MSDELVIYHKNCTDGFGAAYSAWLGRKSHMQFLAMNPGDKLNLDAVRDKQVYVLDFSFTPDQVFKEIEPICKSITILDHHKSAMDNWVKAYEFNSVWSEGHFSMSKSNAKVHVTFDMHRSGALMAWQYFHHHKDVPKFIHHISDADLYRFEDPFSASFNMYVSSQKRQFEVWTKMHQNSEKVEGLSSMYFKGSAMLELRASEVETQVPSRATKPITLTAIKPDGSTTMVKGLSKNASGCFGTDLGSQLAIESGTFGLVWETDGVTCFCSIRSVEGTSCIEIATPFGGGGHAKSSGFRMPLSDMIHLLNKEI